MGQITLKRVLRSSVITDKPRDISLSAR